MLVVNRARPFAGAAARLARLVPGGKSPGRAGRAPDAPDAEYDEALRRAFRAAIPLESTRTVPRPVGEDEPATEDPSSGPAATPAGALSPAMEAAPAAATDLLGDIVAGDFKARGLVAGELDAGALDESEATRNVDATDDLDSIRADERLDEIQGSAAGLPPADGFARANGHQPGPTAPEDLLEVPESVGATVDDFFGGLVRRVERRA